jgi:hypothetical protein
MLTGNGVVVVDFDYRSGGKETMAWLIANGHLPETAVNKTPGGYHWFYAHPEGQDIHSVTGMLRGVDAKSWHSYVVVPPSTRSDGAYTARRGNWRDRSTYAQAPAWVLNALISRCLPDLHNLPTYTIPLQVSNSSADKALIDHSLNLPAPQYLPPSVGNLSVTDSLDLYGYAGSEFVCDPLPDAVPAGTRDSWATAYAGHLVRSGVTQAEAVVMMTHFHTLVEQPRGDLFTLQDALGKVTRAYAQMADKLPLVALDTAPAKSLAGGGGVTRHEPVTPTPEPVVPDAVTVTPPHEPTAGGIDLDGFGGEVDETAAHRTGGQITDDEAHDRFIFVTEGSQVVDLTLPPSAAILSMEDFKNMAKNLRVGQTQVSTRWMGSPNRQSVRSIAYHPGTARVYTDEIGVRRFNPYQGSMQELPEVCDPDKVQPFVDHMNYLFPDEAAREIMWNWIAFTVQRPELRIQWMPLLVSKGGVGKNRLFEVLKRVVGAHNVASTRVKNIEGEFNYYLDRTTVVLLDDIPHTKARGFVDDLSPQITEPVLPVNIKNRKQADQKIFSNFIGFTNYDDALPLRPDERRYWVYKITADPQHASYYRALTKWIGTDGPAHLEAYLRAKDLSAFDHSESPPDTRAKREMGRGNGDYLTALVEDAIDSRTGPFVCSVIDDEVVAAFLSSNCIGSPPHDLGNIARRICREISEPIERSIRTGGQGSKQIRVRVVKGRDVAKWRSAGKGPILSEFNRAIELAYNRPDPGPSFEIVDEKRK